MRDCWDEVVNWIGAGDGWDEVVRDESDNGKAEFCVERL